MNESGPALMQPEWPAPPAVHAAFSLRSGGVSESPYDTLNLGALTGDAPERVAENRRRVKAALALAEEPAWLEQVHGARVVSLDERGPVSVTARADGAVTREAGRVCSILAADCLPVLFAARDGSAVGAAHAGWRGLAAGVLEATVQALGVDPEALIAWLGPAIGPRHFEVGDEVRAAFLATQAQADSAFVRNARGRWQCDLYRLARQRLESLGVRAVFGGGWCTYSDAGRFFSYRRDGRCGRMAALVWLSK